MMAAGRPASLPRPRPAIVDRQRAVQAFQRQMLHEAEEEGQIVLPHPLLVEGEDVGALRGVEKVVGVLHAFGDALVGQHRADVVGIEEGGELLVADFRIDRHRLLRRLLTQLARQRGKNTLSSAVDTRLDRAPRSARRRHR